MRLPTQIALLHARSRYSQFFLTHPVCLYKMFKITLGK